MCLCISVALEPLQQVGCLCVRLGAMDSLACGDAFWMTGPVRRGRPTWCSGKYWGWRPQAWTSHHDDRMSQRVSEELWDIDFGRRFVAEEIHHSTLFVTAKVAVSGGVILATSAAEGCFPYNYIWINVAKWSNKGWDDWAKLAGREGRLM